MPLILSLAAPGSPCRLLRPSVRLAGQWHAPYSTTVKSVHQRHTPRSNTPTCPPTTPRRPRRPTTQRMRSHASFSLRDGICPYSTQLFAKAPQNDDVLDREGPDTFGFLRDEEELPSDEDLITSNCEQRLDYHTFGLSASAETAADEIDISGLVSGKDRPKTTAGEHVPELGEAPQRDKLYLAAHVPSKAQKSRHLRKALRRSRPATVLDSIQTSARDLYPNTPPENTDLSQISHGRRLSGGQQRRNPGPAHLFGAPSQRAEAVSLYSIVSRCLGHISTEASRDTPFVYSRSEQELLQRQNFSQELIHTWASSLLETNSNTAASIFRHDNEAPPFFIVLLFLRRKHIRIHALGVILGHISVRLEKDSMGWKTLKIVIKRALHHARRVWPESIPWISTLFTNKAASIRNSDGSTKPLPPRALKELTHLCNTLLTLISLPSSVRPMIASRHQENAQFRILQFMAACDPSIAVTRSGFRSVARIQLTHGKTEEERDWAELKGPSWPPWKESRTSMDDHKGYEYGASRASKILHRMFEAGYAARTWEDVAQVYAGWDTDLSPTIQTRTLLPIGIRDNHTHQLWAARIRTTRTRREAWACFLAHETSGTPTHEDIYLAMFEKLNSPELQRCLDGDHHYETTSDEMPEHTTATLLPGDMKEVVADPSSPLHNVYLTEPVPTYEEFYRRMTSKNVRPTTRLLAFLLETYPDFTTTCKLLEKAKDDFNGGVGCLLTGNHGATSTVDKIPGYFLAAFIRFLCRFGHPTNGLSVNTTFLPPSQHAQQFLVNETYLLGYAYALLLHYKPRQQSAWTAFVERVVFSRFGNEPLYHEKESATGITDIQYRIVTKILDTLASIDIDVQGDFFNLACTATRYAAQAVHRGSFPLGQGRDVLTTRSYRLRKLFHQLIGTYADPEFPVHTASIPPHIPGPAELHAYVRALGVLRDYEGLYSFSTWLTKNHVEVTARARAQRGGNNMLFRTLVALRAATGGWLEEGLDTRPTAPKEIKQLIQAQIDSVQEWGGWPSNKDVSLYIEGHVRSATPKVGGR